MKKIIFTLFFFLFWKINVFSEPVTHKQTVTYDNGSLIAGVAFNDDGKKVFTSFANKDNTVGHHINEFNLTVPYDISSGTYAGDGERCLLDQISTSEQVYDLELKDSGKKLFVTTRGLTTVEDASRLADNIFRYDLETAFDISTCTFSQKAPSLETEALEFINGSNAGNVDLSTRFKRKDHRLQGIDLSTNGKKIFLSWFNNGDATRILEYSLNNPFDLTTMSLVTSAGILLTTSNDNGVDNASGMSFSKNGKRIFIVSHAHTKVARITQISLTSAFDTSTFSIDGNLVIDNNGSLGDFNDQPRGIDFSPSGLKMYVGNDHDDNIDEIMEYDLACPFNIIAGKCPPITENKDRIAMAEANIDLAKRTIDYSTKSVLNRLKWIKRNKDKQDLSNLNIDFHFLNPKFNTLSKAFGSTIKNTSLIKKNDFKEGNIFYWSEGSVALGKAGETNLSSSKDIKVQSLTYGADKYTKNNGIIGLALRWGVDKVDVGKGNSRIDSNSLNLTLYNTNNLKNNTRFADSIFGIGLIESDIFSDLDSVTYVGENRLGKQIYSTFKVSEHFKKKNLTLIPSGQWDLGFTVFDDYYEKKDQTGNNGGIQVKKQNVKTGSLRAAIAAVQEINHEKYNGKKFGKIEYQSQIMHASNFKYRYTSDQSKFYLTRIDPDSEHHINGEIGFDINFDKYSYFIIYERNQALNYGYTDQIHFAFGYLPDNNTEFLISIDGIDTLANNLKYEKKFNNLNFSFNLKNDLLDPLKYQEAYLNLNTKF